MLVLHITSVLQNLSGTCAYGSLLARTSSTMLERGATGARLRVSSSRDGESQRECGDNEHRARGEVSPGNLSLIQRKHLRVCDHPPDSSFFSPFSRTILVPAERQSREKTRNIYSSQPADRPTAAICL